MVELVYDPEAQKTALASWGDGAWSIEAEVNDASGLRFIPYSPNNNLIKNQAVLLPSRPEEYGSEDRLIADLHVFLHRYLDLDHTF